MSSRIRQSILRLRHDESGQIIVFVCVFMVALLVFLMSVVNLGQISTEKIRLQNAADFSALSAATWQARAMNMEGLFNTTVTAGIVLEVARTLMTGVPPREMPPDWIKLQQASQDWIQQSFNSFTYGAEAGVEKEGFASWAAFLAAQANGGFDATTEPSRVPLYVYRYRFFDAQHRVNPAVGAMRFVETVDTRQYIPPEAGQATPYYRTGGLAFAQDAPVAPGEQGYVVWEHTRTLSSEEDTIWPKSGDEVKVYSGGGNSLSGAGLEFDLLEAFGDSGGLTYSEQIQLRDGLTDAIYELIDQIVSGDGVPELRDTEDPRRSIADVLKDYVDRNLQIDPASKQFEELFRYDAGISNGGQLDVVFEDGLRYRQDDSRSPDESTPDDPVIGHLVVRIFPRVRVGVIPEKAGVELIDGDHRLNQVASGTWSPRDFGYRENRYYDTVAKQEFWDLQTTVFESSRIDSKRVYRTVTVSTMYGSYSYSVFDHWEYRYRVSCPICGATGTTGWRRSRPSNSDCLNVLGSSHRYYSDVSDPHHQGDCVQRCWWYYKFGVEFDVTVRAYMNLDFSTILMAKYTASTDPEHANRPGNEYLKTFKQSLPEGATLECTCARPEQPLTFAQSLLRLRRQQIPQDLTEHTQELRAGTVPVMTAVSAAEHVQGTASSDAESSVGDLFFGMDWHSTLTDSVGLDTRD